MLDHVPKSRYNPYVSYSDLLRDPRWQRKRLEVMSAAGFACIQCGDTETTLNVHHTHYVKGRKPWEYDASELRCLCEPCHGREHGKAPTREQLAATATNRRPVDIDARKAKRRRAAEEQESSAERELIRFLLHRPALLEQVVEHVDMNAFKSAPLSRIYFALIFGKADSLEAELAGFTAERHPTGGGSAIDLARELLADASGLEHAAEGVAGAVSVMRERALCERMAEIDQEMPAASDERKDELMSEKVAVMEQLRAFGGKWWKRFR